jgi:hypothetical protein
MQETPETVEMWETLRVMWSSGMYATMGALHRKAVEKYGEKAPGLPAMRRRSDREMWSNEDALAEEIQEEEKKASSRILAELGMGISRRMEILAEVINAPLEDHDQLKKIIMKIAENGFITDPKQIAGAMRELRQLYTTGLGLTLKALALAGQYAGDLQPKQEGETPDGKDLSTMTEEDKQHQIKELLKRMNLYVGTDPITAEKNGISSGV